MRSFNLLPWRETLRRRRGRLMVVACAMIWIGCAALVLALRAGMTLQQSKQQQRNDFLAGHIETLDRQINRITKLGTERERLIQRIQIIQDLQRERVLFGNLLQELVRQMPQGVSLDALHKDAGRLTLTGVALSNARVSDLMSRLEASPWFTDAELKAIEADGQAGQAAQRSHFTLGVSIEAEDDHES